MPTNSITLDKVTRNSLISIQRNEAQSNDRQRALSTGKRVNSIVDDPVAYLAAKSLTDKASDLAATKDLTSSAVSTVSASLEGLNTVDTLLRQLSGIAQAGQATSNAAEKASYAGQYNDLREQIDLVVADASYQGTNLLTAGTSVSVGNVTVSGSDISVSSLGLSAVAADGSNFGTTQLDEISAATTSLRQTASSLGSSISSLTIQSDNAEKLGNIATEAGLKLTQANLPEEAAGLVASRTRQQLAQVSQTISSDQQRSILSLF